MSAATAVVTEVNHEPQSEYALCEHVKDNGLRCGSPALRGRHFCYHHSRAHAPAGRIGERGYRAPLPETIESLQLQVQYISEALGSGRITHQVAGKLLYAVQLSTNLLELKNRRTEGDKGAPFKPSVGLSGVVDPDRQPKTDDREPDTPSSDLVTDIPDAMKEVLAPRPFTEQEEQTPLAGCPTDPDMPQTIEEAQRALLEVEQFVALEDALRKCDRLSPRYYKLIRRLQIHNRAKKILLKADLFSVDAWCEALTIIANARERKQKKM